MLVNTISNEKVEAFGTMEQKQDRTAWERLWALTYDHMAVAAHSRKIKRALCYADA